jgi:hypothetical protein
MQQDVKDSFKFLKKMVQELDFLFIVCNLFWVTLVRKESLRKVCNNINLMA